MYRFAEGDDLARTVIPLTDVKTQADHGICAKDVGTLSQSFERFSAQVLGVAQKLVSADTNQHPQTAKRRTQTVPGTRRDARNESVPLHDAVPVELVERHDAFGFDHRNMAAVMAHSSPSVLVIRLDAIGDALALTPLLAGLAARDIPVDLVMRAANTPVFSSRAARTSYVAPFALRSSTAANRRAIHDFGSELQAARYTHVLVATEDPGGYRLARALDAPERIGFVNGWGKPFKTLWAGSMLTRRIVRSAGLDPKAPHECEVLWQLGASLLGDAAVPRDATLLRPLVVERDPGRGGRIAFQVSDKWERLGIASDEVVRALRSVAARFELRALASEAERDYAERIAAAACVPVEQFATLEPWKEAIASARALVAPDSGAIHVAGMTGTPVVAVFPPIADFALQSARWQPWAAPSKIVRATDGWPDAIAPALDSLL